MDYSTLSLEQTPPFSVPLRYFLTAPLFGAAGGILLLLQGPELLATRWTPGALGLTHLYTLGFMAMVMIGAMQQLLPVLAGTPIRNPRRISGWLHLLLTVGAATLVGGFLAGSSTLFVVAGVALLVLVGIFAVVGLVSLRRARSAHASVRSMRLAVVGFAVTGLLGLYLVLGHANPSTAPARHLTDIHLAWGLVGWVGILVAGIAYQVVPMFQITPDYPRWMTPRLTPLVLALLVLWSVLVLGIKIGEWPAEAFAWLIGLLAAAALVTFAVVTLDLQRRRRRKLKDVTLAFWRLGMACLMAASGVWAIGTRWSGLGDYGLALGVLMVFGFAVSVISGMVYKIVPFLTWLHLTNQAQASRLRGVRVPNMKQVIPVERARAQFYLHCAALAALLASIPLPSVFFYPAAALLVASNALLFANVLFAALLFRNKSRSLGDLAAQQAASGKGGA